MTKTREAGSFFYTSPASPFFYAFLSFGSFLAFHFHLPFHHYMHEFSFFLFSYPFPLLLLLLSAYSMIKEHRSNFPVSSVNPARPGPRPPSTGRCGPFAWNIFLHSFLSLSLSFWFPGGIINPSKSAITPLYITYQFRLETFQLYYRQIFMNPRRCFTVRCSSGGPPSNINCNSNNILMNHTYTLLLPLHYQFTIWWINNRRW